MNFEAPRSSSSGPRRRTPHHRAQARVLTAGTCIECLLLPRRALPPRRRTAGDRRRSLAGLPRAGTVPPGAAEVPANAQPERRTLIARSQGGPPRARNPRSPSPSPSPICRGSGMGVPSPICRGPGIIPDPHPRFAGDRGSIPTAIPDSPGIGPGDHPHPRSPSGIPRPGRLHPPSQLVLVVVRSGS